MTDLAYDASAIRSAELVLMRDLPEGTLMQRAATGLATACLRRLKERTGRVYGARVLLLVGPGNNGADGLWAGSQLARRGVQVTAVLAGQPVSVEGTGALAAFRRAGGRVVAEVHEADLVVDALVGIGGSGPLRGAAAALVAQLTGAHLAGAQLAGIPDVVACDIPSGVDADTGAVEGPAVRAALTVTFGAYKPGLLVGAGRAHAGEVQLVEIGLALGAAPVQALTLADVPALLPAPDVLADKYSRGVLGVAAGSQTYPGAAVLAVGAAIRAGAGMVRFAGAPHPAEQVRLRWPESVVTEAAGTDMGKEVVQAGRVQAWVVGPGLGTDERAAQVVRAVLGSDVPVLVDADALTLCAQHPEWLRREAPTLLTPHDREFARFGDPVGADRLGAARALAERLGVTVLLKGDATIVVGPEGPARVNRTGSSVLATAGSGDVLSGAGGALLAQGLTALDAGSVAAFLHGRAGALSARGASTSAYGILEAWPDAVREAVHA